jgi:hypothetical protein
MSLSKYYIYFLTLFPIIILSLIEPLFQEVFATPAFARQEIKDNPFDLVDVMTHERAFLGNQSIDIRRVNYFSDGRFLNATLWLLSQFNEKPSESSSNRISYGMYIDADSNEKTGWQGVDYQMEIAWQNGTWTRTLVEYSSLSDIRILEINRNYTGFFEKGGRFVLLSLNQDAIISPNKYKVIFYAAEENNDRSTQKMDFTNWVYIPPPEFVISASTNSIILRPGEEKIIEIQVNSTTGFEPTISFSAINQNGIGLNFKSNRVNIPSYGMATLPLEVKILGNATARPYTIHLIANATFQPNSLESLIEPESEKNSFMIPKKSENIIKQSNLIIEVLEPLSFEDKFSDSWNKIGAPLQFIYGVAAGIAPWIFNIIREKRKRRNSKISI